MREKAVQKHSPKEVFDVAASIFSSICFLPFKDNRLDLYNCIRGGGFCFVARGHEIRQRCSCRCDDARRAYWHCDIYRDMDSDANANKHIYTDANIHLNAAIAFRYADRHATATMWSDRDIVEPDGQSGRRNGITGF